MPAAAQRSTQRDVACVHCGLACDDLAIEAGDSGLQIVEAGCWLSRRQLASLAQTNAAPTVDGAPADLDAAVARAAGILGRSVAPAFVVASDVAGARAALKLAERTGGVVDHPDSGALFRVLATVQDSGALTTTLSEVRNRADCLLVVGPDPVAAFPRFYERCIEPRRTLFADGAPARALLRIGPRAEDAAPDAPLVEELSCPQERLPEVLAALGALANDRPVAPLELPGLDAQRLADVVARLEAARYGILAWAPALFDDAQGAIVAHALLELARAITRTTRCSVLAVGGSANLIGVNQVCLWQTGLPLRTSLAHGVPEHDPYRYSARRMIAAGEADALVWISGFDALRLPPESSVPTVLLAPPGITPPRGIAAYVPIGVPGVDHTGQIFRSDGVVALPLAALRASALPQAASVLGLIETRLGERKAHA
jgi:formylmethanofuran dehydrogenase subunit B